MQHASAGNGQKTGSGHKHHEHGHHNHHSHHAHMVRDFKRRFAVSIVLTVPILALSPMLQQWTGLEETLAFPGETLVQAALATLLFFYGGWPFLKGAFNELKKMQPGMMTLIGLAVVVAYGYSAAVALGVSGRVFFWELATLIDVMLLGHWVEMRSVMGASSAVEDLVKLLPSEAHRIQDDGGTEDVPVTELTPGDKVLVKPGEKVPVDGEILEGATSVDVSMVTGESKAVEKGAGDKLIGGTVNGDASVRVEVRKVGEDTYLSQVVNMVRQAQQSRSRAQDLANRAAFWLTVVAIAAGALTLAGWLLAGNTFVFSLQRMVTVMVITCPHALGLAVPLVVAVSTAMGARNGLLVRNRAAFERSRLVDVVVFDKTGTLTEGRFGVSEVAPREGHDETAVLRAAASLESESEHPIAQGITRHAREQRLDLARPKNFKSIPGKGAQAELDGKTVKVVSLGYLHEQNIDPASDKPDELAAQGKTVVAVLEDDTPVGYIALADILRGTSKDAIQSLRRMGYQAMMITGDSKEVAEAVAAQLDLDDFFAEVLPGKKAERIHTLRDKGMRVAMVGDGINDAPALAEADVGIAIGAGTDVAMEAADVVLVNSNPADVLQAVRLARNTYRKMVQNLWWAAGYNIVAIPLAAGVLAWAGILLPPAVGALIMSISTVVVAVNAKLFPELSP